MLCILLIFTFVLCFLPSCGNTSTDTVIVCTIRPLSDFTKNIVKGIDGIQVKSLVTTDISCLHDYTLTVNDMKTIEKASLLFYCGSGLEPFMDLVNANYKSLDTCDTSEGIEHIETECDHGHEGHKHDTDPHVWLSPLNAEIMVNNILKKLCNTYPHYKDAFEKNAEDYIKGLKLSADKWQNKLSDLSMRKIVTFHDGFSYFAEFFNLEILAAIEEEAGSGSSAGVISSITKIIKDNSLPCIFVEKNGSHTTAQIISNECGVKMYTLDMIMSGDTPYIEAMENNVEAIYNALIEE